MKVATIAGTVGKDAVLRRTNNGDPILGFSVAVDDGYGENKTTIWFDVAVWGKRGQALEPHITKGSKITVNGELGTRDHNGKTYLTIRASEVSLQGGNERREAAPRQSTRDSYGNDLSDDLNDDVPF